ncbi:hypothetical protein [Phytobacter sp. AG2a]
MNNELKVNGTIPPSENALSGVQSHSIEQTDFFYTKTPPIFSIPFPEPEKALPLKRKKVPQ